MRSRRIRRGLALIIGIALSGVGASATGCNELLGIYDEYELTEDAGAGGVGPCDEATGEGTTTFYLDSDNDDFGNEAKAVNACAAPPGYVAEAADCNDSNPTIRPGAADVCDAVDNDCDGTLDNGAECCVDGVKRGDETHIDCGGSVCPACDAGETCEINSDCVSLVCSGGVCQAPTCGDGVKNGVQAGEACDDGNLASGDGCSEACAIESGFGCAGDQPSVCATICGDLYVRGAEECDDGGTANGDGCSSACAWEVVAEVEANNTKAGADAAGIIITNDRLISGSIDSMTDVDVFKLTVPAGGAVARFETFDASGTDCVGIATTMKLYTSVFVQTNTSAGTGDGIGSCSAVVVNLVSGTYYVSVEETGQNATIAAYRLQVKLQAIGSSESEPNNMQATADPLPTTAPPDSDVFISGARTAADASADWYAISVPHDKSIRAEVIEGDYMETCESTEVDSRLTLFNAAATQLAQDDNAGRGSCSLIDGTGATPLTLGAKDLAAGVYYLSVDSAVSGTPGEFNYKLFVTIR